MVSSAEIQSSRVQVRKSPGRRPSALFTRMSGAGQAASAASRPCGVVMSAATAVTVTPSRADFVRGALQHVARARHDRDVDAFLRQRQRARLAEAAARAGQQRLAAAYAKVHAASYHAAPMHAKLGRGQRRGGKAPVASGGKPCCPECRHKKAAGRPDMTKGCRLALAALAFARSRSPPAPRRSSSAITASPPTACRMRSRWRKASSSSRAPTSPASSRRTAAAPRCAPCSAAISPMARSTRPRP